MNSKDKKFLKISIIKLIKIYSYALKDLPVGDMPQTNLVLGFTITPVEGATVQLLHKTYMSHYSDWNVSSREFSDADDAYRENPWQAPDYSVLDLHASYNLPFQFGPAKPKVFLHVFNALDATYIQDATNNSSYNAWDGSGSADDAEVYFGMPTSFNIGLSIDF